MRKVYSIILHTPLAVTAYKKYDSTKMVKMNTPFMHQLQFEKMRTSLRERIDKYLAHSLSRSTAIICNEMFVGVVK